MEWRGIAKSRIADVHVEALRRGAFLSTTQQLRGLMSVGEDNDEVEELSRENKFGEESGGIMDMSKKESNEVVHQM